MAWLGTWSRRREITISNTNIDSDLTNFPLPIFLNTTAGTSDTDVSDIFDVLGSNSLKIAITESDGTSQLYAEIERWDDANEKALLWVSKSDLTLSSTGNTTLYIYYDSVQDNNTDYIGTLGNRTEVWDDNYICVYHMADDPGGVSPQLTNSSQDAHHGSFNGTMDSSDLVDGVGGEGYAIHFDGSDDFVSVANHADLNISPNVTVDQWYSLDTTPANDDSYQIVCKGSDSVSSKWSLFTDFYVFDALRRVRYLCDDVDATEIIDYDTAVTYSTGTWFHYSAKSVPSTMTIFYNGASVNSEAGVATIESTDADLTIGARGDGTNTKKIDGKIDEVRISDIGRSADWEKADYNGKIDNLIIFDSVLSPSSSVSYSPSSSQSPSASESPSASISASPSVSVSASPSPTGINTLSVDLVRFCFIIVYDEEYSSKTTDYSNAYGSKITTYGDKYSSKTTDYSDSYEDQANTYSDKYDSKDTDYTDKYKKKRCQ